MPVASAISLGNVNVDGGLLPEGQDCLLDLVGPQKIKCALDSKFAPHIPPNFDFKTHAVVASGKRRGRKAVFSKA
jgi:hypothetical protein